MDTDAIGRMPAARRVRLVRTAAEEFGAAGCTGASLNRILRRCRMSKSSLYHVVASKQDLFELTVRELGASVAERLQVPTPESFTQHFWCSVVRLVDHAASLLDDEDFTLLGRLYHLDDAPTGSGRPALFDAVETWLDSTLEVGRAAGAVRCDLPASLQRELLVGVVHQLDRWSVAHLDQLRGGDGERLLAAQLDVLRRLLEPA